MSSSSPPPSCEEVCKGGDQLSMFDDRRRRMIERLEARRQQSSTVSSSTPQSAEQPTNFDEIQLRAKTLIESGEVNIEASFISELEAALALLPPGLQSRRLRESYNELRSRIQRERSGARTKSAFSFSTKIQQKPNRPTTETPVKEEIATEEAAVECSSALRGKDSICIRDKVNERICVDGEDGKDVSVMNVADCTVEILFHASAVHLKGLRRCKVLMCPVGSSVLIRDCESLTLVAAAQQIRTHNSRELSFHVAVRGAVIIEDCDRVQVAPYKLKGTNLEWTNENWRDVKDFNWLVTGEQSPHWSVMPESLWNEFAFSSN